MRGFEAGYEAGLRAAEEVLRNAVKESRRKSSETKSITERGAHILVGNVLESWANTLECKADTYAENNGTAISL